MQLTRSVCAYVQRSEILEACVVLWFLSRCCFCTILTHYRPHLSQVLLTLSTVVTNTGNQDGDEAVLVFVQSPLAGRNGNPIRRLIDYQKLHLKVCLTTTLTNPHMFMSFGLLLDLRVNQKFRWFHSKPLTIFPVFVIPNWFFGECENSRNEKSQVVAMRLLSLMKLRLSCSLKQKCILKQTPFFFFITVIVAISQELGNIDFWWECQHSLKMFTWEFIFLCTDWRIQTCRLQHQRSPPWTHQRDGCYWSEPRDLEIRCWICRSSGCCCACRLNCCLIHAEFRVNSFASCAHIVCVCVGVCWNTCVKLVGIICSNTQRCDSRVLVLLTLL